jgi:hypothetical protein
MHNRWNVPTCVNTSPLFTFVGWHSNASHDEWGIIENIYTKLSELSIMVELPRFLDGTKMKFIGVQTSISVVQNVILRPSDNTRIIIKQLLWPIMAVSCITLKVRWGSIHLSDVSAFRSCLRCILLGGWATTLRCLRYQCLYYGFTLVSSLDWFEPSISSEAYIRQGEDLAANLFLWRLNSIRTLYLSHLRRFYFIIGFSSFEF